MPQRPPRSEELAAANIVASRLGGTYSQHDTGRTPRQYDFDVVLADGQVVALEVTERPSYEDKELFPKMNKYEWEIAAPQLSHVWNLVLATHVHDYRSLRSEVERIGPTNLRLLEDMGLFHFGAGCSVPAARQMRKLGIEFGSAGSRDEPDGGRIAILPPCGGGATGPELVVTLALGEVSKNLRKLAAAQTAQRHLFVWISEPLGVIGFKGGPPVSIPELPPEVTTLWIGALNWGQQDVWIMTPPEPWESFIAQGG
jgi:hypothetical protein